MDLGLLEHKVLKSSGRYPASGGAERIDPPHLSVGAVCHSSSVEFGRSQVKILSCHLPRANFLAPVFCDGKEMNKTREISDLII